MISDTMIKSLIQYDSFEWNNAYRKQILSVHSLIETEMNIYFGKKGKV